MGVCLLATMLLPVGTRLYEAGVQNDNTGTLVSVINADTNAATINNTKVQGLVNLGSHAFTGYPLSNSDLKGALVSSLAVTANNGITQSVSNPTGVGTGTITLGLSGVPNNVLAGPLLDSVTAGTGIDVSSNPSSGTGSPTISAKDTTNTVDSADGTEITSTTATTVLTYTPTATGLFDVSLFLEVTTAATTVTATLTYYDEEAAASDTINLTPSGGVSLAVGEYTFPVVPSLRCGTTDPVAVSITAGTANQVYASGWIREAI